MSVAKALRWSIWMTACVGRSAQKQAYAAGNREALLHAVRIYHARARAVLLLDLVVHRRNDCPRWPARRPERTRLGKRHPADASASPPARGRLKRSPCRFL